MRPGSLLVSAVLAAGILPAPPGRADEFENPQVIEVRAPGGDLVMRARRGTASIPGLGDVEQVYGYDVRRGTGFASEGAGVFVLASTSGSGTPGHAHGRPAPGSGDAQGDPCSSGSGAGFVSAESGDIRYSYVIARDHPSGMYWFHPHPHGLSEGQVSNGLAGLMLVGSFWDHSYMKCRITASPDVAGLDACRDQEAQREELAAERRADAAGGLLEVRYLAFKDIQVLKLKGGPGGLRKPRFRLIEFPLRPDPGDRSANEAFADQTDARKSRCGELVASSSGHGELAYADGLSLPGQCWHKERPDERWIFTVSGQVHPRITVKAGQAEVWHLANIGADVTYRLRLETIEEKPRRLAFEVRALDGAAFPPDWTRRRHTEIVLMPGARIEVLMQRCSERTGASTTDDHRDCVDPSQTVHARLRTAGLATGIDDQSGDRWPPVDLASVVFEAAPEASSAKTRSIPAPAPLSSGQVSPETPTSPPAPAGPVSTPPPSPGSGACDHRPYQAGPADFRVDSNLVRLIRFNNRDFGEHGGELFGIHVENFRMVDKAGKSIAVADLLAEGRVQRRENQTSAIASISLDDSCWKEAAGEHANPAEFARFYPAFKMTGSPDVTATYGAREYWLLVNDSDECHNFHIHQTKFVVLDADFSAAGEGTPATQCLGDRGLAPPVNRNVLHDNYPLPPRARVFVMIRFDGPKLGRFVFHCHILEHEDKGMMATIGVVDGPPPGR